MEGVVKGVGQEYSISRGGLDIPSNTPHGHIDVEADIDIDRYK
jgi:hypothetical protein